MKVLLLRPKPHQATIGLQSIMICEPLELEYLASVIAEKHEVELVDMILEKKPLAFYINKHKPQLVAITAYIAHINVIKQYARIIKNIDTRIKVVVGGVHAEVVPEDFLDEKIDFIIKGDALQVFPKLLDGLAIDKPELSSAKIIGHKTRALPPFFPYRKLTGKYRKKYYYVFHNSCALIKTSYGCPFTCSFCFCRQITADQYYERPLNNVIAELKEIEETEIYIVDDNFLFSPSRVEKFCDLLLVNNIKKNFLIYGRADFIVHNETVINKFAQVGLRAVIVGLETAQPEELKLYNKKSTVTINEKAIEILEKYNIDCYATLILGIDWDEKDFGHLYRWLKKCKLRFINLQPFTPLPGTPLFNQYQDRLIIPREKYEEWDLANLVVKPSKLSVRKYYYNILKVYFKITLSWESLRKNFKYGFRANFKLSLGVARITWQYLKKLLRNGAY